MSWVKPKMVHGKLTKYNWLPYYPKRIYLGNSCDIGAFTSLFAHNLIVIGENVQIGSHCALYTKNTEDKTEGRIVLKKNCKVGSHSIILPGVQIGENTKVGAFSLVKESLPANVVAVGVPVKIIKKRGETRHESEYYKKVVLSELAP